jgi:hypothetical protein
MDLFEVADYAGWLDGILTLSAYEDAICGVVAEKLRGSEIRDLRDNLGYHYKLN